MSRGPGQYQLTVIRILAGKGLPVEDGGDATWFPMSTLAAKIAITAAGEVNRPQLRRAVRALERNGYVEVCRGIVLMSFDQQDGHVQNMVMLTPRGMRVYNERHDEIPGQPQPEERTDPYAEKYVQHQMGYRTTDRCDSCARLFAETDFAGIEYGGYSGKADKKVRGLALCRDCQDGMTDPIALVSDGEFRTIRMDPLQCADCSSQLSERGLRRIYIDGASLPLCDECFTAHNRRSLAKSFGITEDDVPALIEVWKEGRLP